MISSSIVLLVGLLGVMLGITIRKYKMGYLVRGIDLEKYDNDKTSQIMGNFTLVCGICITIIGSISFILNGECKEVIGISIVLVATLTSLAGNFKVKRYARIE
ncbi:DUF3784 domain-containing protein [Paraclostridium sordellii]|uniref:DUF3784 domain-containing protein n=1 Tax=Paraclostridium sordellii TaxID=1505 RepID=UPI000386AE84|nr:DUF3784 domain-containing protein [Paeniclostridium sordellii]EPZ56322.1 hypothetical protein H476_2924 [[Clostridium] sordellii VPI 9048] [Paeniclostridium sordellii VPI 9048]CEK37949.1 hypothetical protein JGS6382_12811 [[Clostridium] sordellii] [Paeniclostridium sordellii]